MPRSMVHTPETLQTSTLQCNAFRKPDKKTVKMLKETGDIGVTIKFDPKTGLPVVWVWQTFTVIRLDIFQALTLAAKIVEVCYAHLRKPKKPKDVAKDDED